MMVSCRRHVKRPITGDESGRNWKLLVENSVDGYHTPLPRVEQYERGLPPGAVPEAAPFPELDVGADPESAP